MIHSKTAAARTSVWRYGLLAILFAITLVSQIPFTVDVIRAWSGDYAGRPVRLGAPWPSIAAVDGAAEQAGLRVGDRVLAIDGRVPEGRKDLQQPVRGRRPGDALPITVLRDGAPVEFRPTLRAVELDRGLIITTYILMPWFALVLGFWIAGMRPHDRLAWITLGILIGLAQLYRPDALDGLGWPGAMGAVAVAVRESIVFVWAACMLLFGFLFPKPGRMDAKAPWLKFLLTIPLALIAVWDAARGVAFGFDYRLAEAMPENPLPRWLVMALIYVSISLFFAGLGEKYSDQSLGRDDRRRLRLMYWGCSAALSPSALLLLYYAIVYHTQPRDSALAEWATMAMILLPATMAYVIVVERAMDVRMVIRQGVQYALARRGVKVLQILVTIGVVTGIVALTNSEKLTGPQQLFTIAVSIILVLRIRDGSERLRRWLDRRFFREAYNSEKILSDLSEQVRGILDRDALLETVARRISESLHVDQVAVMLRQNGMFRPALAIGYAAPPGAAWAADDETVGELRAKRTPLAIEAGKADGLAAELLLPLTSQKDLLGFISLGPKRSEEPYSESDTSLLRTVAVQTGLALENSRLSVEIATEVAHRETLVREIEIAREVQQRLFPQTQPEVPALSYAGYCRPARGVGGDYYDFLALASGKLGLAIGDVSGKGVPAALLMASLQASVRGQSQAEGRVAELMTNVNRLVCDASTPNRYATFFYGQFDPASCRLLYSNGGHNPPMLLRGNEVLRLEAGGPPVGLFRPSPYQQEEIQLQPGDLLLFFTDGISEAENPAEDEWGEDRLVEAARECRELPPQEMIGRIMQAADDFASGAPQHDDMTLVIARVLTA